MERKLLGIRAYARHRGVSPAAVRKARDTGRIAAAFVKSGGRKKLIDVEVADRLWDANTDAAQQRPEAAAGSASSTSSETAKPEHPPAAPPSAAPSGPSAEEIRSPSADSSTPASTAPNGRKGPTVKPGQDLFGETLPPKLEAAAAAEGKDEKKGPSFLDVRTTSETWKGELMRLRYMQTAGELVSAARARELFFRFARNARDKILAIPVRVSHDFAAEEDPIKVERRLKKELERALESLASDLDL